MKRTLGQPARYEEFFPRDFLVEKIYSSLDNRAQLLIAAPRRIGKTSILFHIKDNPREGYCAFYTDTEAIKEANKFFREIGKLIIESEERGRTENLKHHVKGIFGKITEKVSSLKIGGFELSFNQQDQDHFEGLKKLLEELPEGALYIIMIDEFPITIENIAIEAGPEAAIEFLKLNRTLRLDPIISKKVRFVYTGSVGLLETVKKFDATSMVNDLQEVRITPLTRKEGISLFKLLLEDKKVEEVIAAYVMDKILWLIPYHIQLVADAVYDLMHEEDLEQINEALIDKAFNRVVADGDKHLDHYRTRLKTILTKEEAAFSMEAMKMLCNNERIQKAQLFDLSAAEKYGVSDKFSHIMKLLEHDGYIVVNENDNSYTFYSPILKHWWKRNA